jgi:hypothetical protein
MPRTVLPVLFLAWCGSDPVTATAAEDAEVSRRAVQGSQQIGKKANKAAVAAEKEFAIS